MVAGCLAAGLAAARRWRSSVAVLAAACLSGLDTGLLAGLEARLYSTTDAVSQALRPPAD